MRRLTSLLGLYLTFSGGLTPAGIGTNLRNISIPEGGGERKPDSPD